MKNHNYRNKGWLFLLFPLMLFLITGLVMLLWNAILPDVLGVKTITYWQAMGILVLCKILFGGFHGGRKKFASHRREQSAGARHNDTHEDHFKSIMKERFERFCRKNE